MTPNQVTAVSSVFTFASLALLATVEPGWIVSPVVVVGLLIGYAVDSADGQLARLRGGGSPSGEWLDHMTDAAKMVGIHLVVLIVWYRYFEVSSATVLLIPLAFTVQSVVFFFGVILTDQLRRGNAAQSGTSSAAQAPAAGSTAASAPALRSVLVLPADYGVLCLLLLLLPLHRLFTVLYVLLLVANVVFLAGALRNWFRELAALGRPVN